MSVEEDKLKASNGDILVPNNNLYPTEIDINASKVIATYHLAYILGQQQ